MSDEKSLQHKPGSRRQKSPQLTLTVVMDVVRLDAADFMEESCWTINMTGLARSRSLTVSLSGSASDLIPAQRRDRPEDDQRKPRSQRRGQDLEAPQILAEDACPP